MTNKSQVGGILSIVSGALGVLSGLSFAALAIFFPVFMRIAGSTTEMDRSFAWIIAAVYGVFALGCLLISALSIVGGIFAMKRRRWPVALAGAIASCIVFFPTGVAAVVMTVMGQNEFTRSTPPTPAAPPPATPV